MDDNELMNNIPDSENTESVPEAVAEEVSEEVKETVEEVNEEVKEEVSEEINEAKDEAVESIEKVEETVEEAAEEKVEERHAPAFEADTEKAVFEAPKAASETPVFAPEEPKKKNSKKMILIAAIAAVVVILGVIIAVNASVIKNTFAKLTKNSDDYTKYVLSDKVDDIASLASGYLKSAQDVSTSGDLTVSGSAEIKADEEVLDLVEDADFMENLNFDFSVAQKDNNLYAMELSVYSDSKTKVSLNVVVNYEEALLYIQVPEIDKTWNSFDISDALDDFSDADVQILSENASAVNFLTPAELEDFINRYGNIIIEQIEDVDESSKKIKAEGVSEKLTILEFELDEDKLCDIVTAVCDAMLEDEKLEEVYVTYFDSMGDYMDIDGDEFWDNFCEEIEFVKDNVEEDTEDCEMDVVLYVDKKGDIAGFDVSIKDSWDDVTELSFIRTISGSKFGFEFNVHDEYDEFNITGSGKVGFGKKFTGVMTIEFDDFEFDVSFENFVCNGKKCAGTVSISLEDFIKATDMSSSDAEMFEDFEGGSLEFTFSISAKEVSFGFAFTDGKTDWLSIKFDLKRSDSAKISVPKDAEEYDEDELEEVYDEDFIDSVDDILHDMGFPKHLLSEFMS